MEWDELDSEALEIALRDDRCRKERRAMEILSDKTVKLRTICMCRELLCAAQKPAVLTEAASANVCTLEPIDLPTIAELLAGTDGGEEDKDGELIDKELMQAPEIKGRLGSVRRWRQFK